MKIVGEQMTPHNDLNNLLTAAPLDAADDFDYAAADRGNVAAIGYQGLTSWPTQHMTATWGS